MHRGIKEDSDDSIPTRSRRLRRQEEFLLRQKQTPPGSGRLHLIWPTREDVSGGSAFSREAAADARARPGRDAAADVTRTSVGHFRLRLCQICLEPHTRFPHTGGGGGGGGPARTTREDKHKSRSRFKKLCTEMCLKGGETGRLCSAVIPGMF